MSIIIAKIDNNQCVFMSDTKVSIDNGDKTVTGDCKIRMSPNDGVLKIHILTPRICIAYAGNVEIASQIIHSFIVEKPQTIEKILSYFQDQLKLKNDFSQFIVGLIFPDNSPVLYKIDRNNIEQGKIFWIGEYDAFKEFQIYFNNLTKNNSILDAANKAFNDLIQNTEIKTIGDFTISTYFDNTYNSFIYEYGAKAFGGYKITEIKEGETKKISEGETEEGSFVVTNLISNETGKPAICLYFSKGNTGFLYLPISEKNINVKPIIINNVTHFELLEKVKNDYEIELIGFEINKGSFKFIQ